MLLNRCQYPWHFTAMLLAVLSYGCATQENYVIGESSQKLPVGFAYAYTPPRLVPENVRWSRGQSNQHVAWDSTKNFGPVPNYLQQRGDQICQSVGASKAIGYHPLAEDLQGKPIKGGGFYCG
jgi:hypothetical protein